MAPVGSILKAICPKEDGWAFQGSGSPPTSYCSRREQAWGEKLGIANFTTSLESNHIFVLDVLFKGSVIAVYVSL